MWLFTTYGFYSVVQKPGETKLTIRARVRADLDRLRARHLPSLGPTEDHTGTDYPYRARAYRSDVATAMAAIAQDITYSNFKSAVHTELGHGRAAAYGEVWSVMDELTAREPDPIGRPRGGRRLAYGGLLIDAHVRVLLREVANHYDGYVWTFPKGAAEPGDSPEAAAIREVREETGIEGRIVGALDGWFRGGTSDTRYFVMVPEGPAGAADSETKATRWVTLAEAETLLRETTNEVGRARDLRVLRALGDYLSRRPAGR